MPGRECLSHFGRVRYRHYLDLDGQASIAIGADGHGETRYAIGGSRSRIQFKPRLLHLARVRRNDRSQVLRFGEDIDDGSM